MMRIAYVSTDAGIPVFGRKGASVHVQGIVAAFLRAGHEVHLISPRLGDTAPAWANAVTVHQLSRGSGSPAQAGEAMDAELKSVLRAPRPFDLIYERHALWSCGAMTFAKSLGIPGVLEVNAPLIEEHVTHRGAIDVQEATRLARGAIELATIVIAVSEAVAQATRQLAPGQEHVHVEANGIDVDRFARAHITPVRPFTIGFVGTLKPWHGLSALAPLLKIVRQTIPDAELLVVGDGPERESVEAQLRETGLAGACRWAGAVAPAEVGSWLAQMDVGLAPYPADTECYFSPLKVVEYMAAGIPVVASATGQLPALLENGRLGMLVPPGDVRAMAAACVALHTAPADRKLMSEAARETVMRTRTWDAVLDRILVAAERAATAEVAP